ncbi:MAG TPA: M23 family metallopeptidase [Pseudomonas sp.]
MTSPEHAPDSSMAEESARLLTAARLTIPVEGVARVDLRDSFHECRGMHRHEAIDIAAPLGTPVIAAGAGQVVKLFDSVPGGHTVYQFDPDEMFVYYYAHLDAYAPGLREGAKLARGDLLGYVGATGNAAGGMPHLHFAIFRLGPDREWWKGEAVNPYPFLDDANR